VISTHGQTLFKILGVVLWVIAIIILMATYGILAKPSLESDLSRGAFYGSLTSYNVYLISSILLLTVGTFLIIYPFKK
jgi:hypothetical protein